MLHPTFLVAARANLLAVIDQVLTSDLLQGQCWQADDSAYDGSGEGRLVHHTAFVHHPRIVIDPVPENRGKMMVNRRLTGLTFLGVLFFVSCARTTPESSDDACGVASETRAAKVSETEGDSTQTAAEIVVADPWVANDEHSAVQHSTEARYASI